MDVCGVDIKVSVIMTDDTDTDTQTVLVVHGDHLCTVRFATAPKRLAAAFTVADHLVTGVNITEELFNKKLEAINTVRKMPRMAEKIIDIVMWCVCLLLSSVQLSYEL